MIALVLSIDSGIVLPAAGTPPGYVSALLPAAFSFSLRCSASGFRSLIVWHAMHLNLSSSFGTITLLSQHIHRRPTLPSSSNLPFFPLVTLVGVAAALSSTGTSTSSRGTSVSLNSLRSRALFVLPNILGKGWLTDRPCWCRAPAVCGRCGSGASARSPCNVGGGSNVACGAGALGNGLSRCPATLLRVGVLLELLPLDRRRDDHDGAIVCDHLVQHPFTDVPYTVGQHRPASSQSLRKRLRGTRGSKVHVFAQYRTRVSARLCG